MKVSKNIMFAAVAALATVGAAHAETTVSRAQVQSDYVAAVKNGDVQEPRSGLLLNQLYPSQYNAKSQASAVSRAQVQAERQDAVRNGEVVDARTGIALNQLYPAKYPNAAANKADATKSREQVKAEAIQARQIDISTHRAQG